MHQKKVLQIGFFIILKCLRDKNRKTVTKYEKNLKNFTDYRWKISKEVNKDLWLLCICPNGQNYSFYRVMIQLGMAKRAAEKN